MRKFLIIGLLAISVLAVMTGTILAQSTDTTTPSATGWLGVSLIESDGQVIIARVVAGSPANAADLLIGDVVTAFNGTAVASASELSDLVKAAAPGDSASLDIQRNGAPVNVDVTLGSAPAWGRHMGRGGVMSLPDALTSAEMLLRADLQQTDAGFEVLSVYGSAFDLQEGDVVTAINGQAVADLNLETLMNDMMAAQNPELTVQVTRGGEEVTLSGGFFGGGFERRFGFGRGGEGMRGRFHGGAGVPMPNIPPEATTEPESTGQA